MILGLTGPQGVGKTTLANLLVKECGYKRIGFADALRDATSIIFGLHPDAYQYPMKEQPLAAWGGRTPRQLLQLLGTEVGRQIDPDVWVKAWARQVEREAWANVVADDVRFDNEARAIKDMGGMVVRLERYSFSSPADAHTSEHGLTLQPDDTWIMPMWQSSDDATYRVWRTAVIEWTRRRQEG